MGDHQHPRSRKLRILLRASSQYVIVPHFTKPCFAVIGDDVVVRAESPPVLESLFEGRRGPGDHEMQNLTSACQVRRLARLFRVRPIIAAPAQLAAARAPPRRTAAAYAACDRRQAPTRTTTATPPQPRAPAAATLFTVQFARASLEPQRFWRHHVLPLRRRKRQHELPAAIAG